MADCPNQCPGAYPIAQLTFLAKANKTLKDRKNLLLLLRHAFFIRKRKDQFHKCLVQILYHVIKAHEKLLNRPDYNFVVRTAPIGLPDEDYHWYISIIPRLSKTAGFEIGSNIYINGSLPELNALELRNVVDILKNKV